MYGTPEQKAARIAAAVALRNRYPMLVKVSPECDRLIAASRNIRIELKAAFPKVKFKVSTSRYSGGNSINVRWVDGPTSGQVDAIINKYAAGSVNGMEDIYEYSDDAWNDVFGDSRYVFSNRDYSVKAIASAMRTVNAKYGPFECFADPMAAAEEFKAGKLQLWGLHVSGFRSLEDRVRETKASRTWALPAKLIYKPEKEVEQEPAA